MAVRIGRHIPEGELIGQSPCMDRLRRQLLQAAAWDVNVLLQGESGTGKELAARMLHRFSGRKSGPFIGVNCAAIHETLVESELFGHKAGAFTGARQETLGFLRAADGGTILLDEVGDMSPAIQSKLLRVLEGRAVVPVGGTEAVPTDVRVIAASHRDLAEAVRSGSFRADLYYRLNVVRLTLPPLRQRRDDIGLLGEHMLQEVAALLAMPPKRLSPGALTVLTRYDWPGNVRELRNAIERAYVLTPGPIIRAQDLPEEVVGRAGPVAPTFPTLDQAIRRHLRMAWELSGGVRRRAAEMLAIDRKRLRRMMCRYGVA